MKNINTSKYKITKEKVNTMNVVELKNHLKENLQIINKFLCNHKIIKF